ncbi:hypothetical protein BB559_000809 [Furculomyces boomerangus]|uniref:Cofilin n=1 Tax=Furculomyces boomerangus TaxID=61424 RepID=A0A2T9Z467_9FUNG|nr:hypothetical protein BB559_000809 [Furculomyces boomerangus]
MASSHITPTPDLHLTPTLSHHLKLKKAYKFIIFKISDDSKEIVIEKTSESKSYDDFVSALPPTDCRFAVYDFTYEMPDGGERQKLCFYSWSPDTAKVKPKMLYASSKDAIRKRLDGINIEIQCTDLDEVSHKSVLEKAMRTSR